MEWGSALQLANSLSPRQQSTPGALSPHRIREYKFLRSHPSSRGICWYLSLYCVPTSKSKTAPPWHDCRYFPSFCGMLEAAVPRVVYKSPKGKSSYLGCGFGLIQLASGSATLLNQTLTEEFKLLFD